MRLRVLPPPPLLPLAFLLSLASLDNLGRDREESLIDSDSRRKEEECKKMRRGRGKEASGHDFFSNFCSKRISPSLFPERQICSWELLAVESLFSLPDEIF